MPHEGRMRAALAVSLMLALSGCRTASSQSVVSGRLDALFADLHARGLFDGAIVVADPHAVLWEKGLGYANAERQVLFTPDTPADGASLAKTFTATLVLMLASEGSVDLDAPVQRYLPELPYPEITLRHLLSHSSGIPVPDYDYFDAFVPPDRVRTTEVLLGVVATGKPPLAFTPGTAFEYSSFGYDLAALAAARAAGKPLGELLRERIFDPLGITSAFLRPGRLDEFPSVRTLAYRHVASDLQLNDVFDREAFHGGSNIYISTRDLSRWSNSFLTRPLLEKPALAQALQPAIVAGSPSGLTLGSWYRNRNASAFSYAGHLQGFHSEAYRDLRHRRSIVYMSNSTIPGWLQHRIVRAVSAILDGATVTPLQPPEVEEIRRDNRDVIHGHWAMNDGNVMTIDALNGHLSLTRSGVSYRMVQTDSRFFYVPGLDYVIGFGKPENGVPSAMYISTNFTDEWGVRTE